MLLKAQDVTHDYEDNIVTGVEIKTSKTYNGKPVYKKVIKATLSLTKESNSELYQTIPHGITNFKECINCLGSIGTPDNGGGYQYPLPFVRSTRHANIDGIDGTDIRMSYVSYPFNSTEFTFILEYTKTID